jgi:hypothetical protein
MATTRKTGPNDVRRIVWAISEYFFKIIRLYIYILNHVYSGLRDRYKPPSSHHLPSRTASQQGQGQ